MNYFEKINEDELRYLCNTIPFNEIQLYLKKYPKEFSKIKPGFRPTSITADKAGAFLFDNRDNRFISTFISKHLQAWMCSIQDYVNDWIEKGDSENQALLRALSKSYFVDNVHLFFKLNESPKNKEEIALFSDAVKYIQDEIIGSSHENSTSSIRNDKKLENEIIKKNEEIKKYKNDIKYIKKENQQLETSQRKKIKEVEELQKLIDTLEENNNNIDKSNQMLCKENKENKKVISELNADIDKLKTELKCKNEEYNKLNALHEELMNEVGTKTYNDFNIQFMRPKSMEEFCDNLERNFSYMGIDTRKDEIQILIKHLENILFLGKPILLNRTVARNIARSVANSFLGTSRFEEYSYDSNDKNGLIEFLNSSGRIICLNGFIGHIDETILLSKIQKYSSKIIFITVDYERTLKFVPAEIMSYVEYINVSRIGEFMREYDLDQETSIIEECIFVPEIQIYNERISSIAKQIARELNFSEQAVNDFVSKATDENALNARLMFSLLPYSIDVFGKLPYMLSRRLEKYAGENGRCRHKEILQRWFDYEHVS